MAVAKMSVCKEDNFRPFTIWSVRHKNNRTGVKMQMKSSISSLSVSVVSQGLRSNYIFILSTSNSLKFLCSCAEKERSWQFSVKWNIFKSLTLRTLGELYRRGHRKTVRSREDKGHQGNSIFQAQQH